MFRRSVFSCLAIAGYKGGNRKKEATSLAGNARRSEGGSEVVLSVIYMDYDALILLIVIVWAHVPDK